MTQEYAARYVREILVKTKGNMKHAESMVLELVKSDEQLLYGLAQPYLGGIVAHAIQRAAKKQSLPDMPTKDWEPQKKRPSQAAPSTFKTAQPFTSKPATSSPKQQQRVSQNAMDGLMAQLAKNMGEGEEAPKPKTSERHRRSMAQIVTKDLSRRKD